MRQFFAVAFLSVLAFAAGYGVRIWVDQTRPVPPPLPLGAEFADGTRVTIAEPSHYDWHSADRTALASDIASLKPQIEVFRKRQKEIDQEFDAALEALLTPEQKDALVQRHKRTMPQPAKGPLGPLTDQNIYWLRQQPFVYAVDHISVEWKVKDLDRDLKFTPEQTVKVRDLLKTRRQEYIALIDDVPPASLSLISLAHNAERLGAPEQPAAPQAKP